MNILSVIQIETKVVNWYKHEVYVALYHYVHYNCLSESKNNTQRNIAFRAYIAMVDIKTFRQV